MALTQRQELAIETILSGGTMVAAAHAAGVSRVGLYRWMSDDEFSSVLRQRQREMRQAAEARLHGLSEEAVSVLHKAISGRKVSRVELEAARDVLNRLERSDIRDTAMRLLDSAATGDTSDDEATA